MIQTKEIKHPLRTIALRYDDAKPFSDFENELLKAFLSLHDEVLAVAGDLKDLQQLHADHQEQALQLEKEFTQIPTAVDSLEKRGQKMMQSGVNNEMGVLEYNQWVADANKHRDVILSFNHKLNKVVEIKQKIDQMSDALEAGFDEIDESIEQHSDLISEFIKDTEKYSFDWQSLDDESENLYGIYGKIVKSELAFSNEMNKFLAFYNPFIDLISDTFTKFNALSETGNILVKKFNQDMDIEELESTTIYFEWIDKPPYAEIGEFARIGLAYDIERIAENEWMYHLDNSVFLENAFDFCVRTTFKIKGPEWMIFTEGPTRTMIKLCLDVSKNGLKARNKEAGGRIDNNGLQINDETLDEITKLFVEEHKDRKPIDNDPQGLFIPTITINKFGIFNLFAAIVIHVMDQVLFTNHAFNRESNREQVDEILRISKYITLKLHLPKMNNGDIDLHSRDYSTFLFLIECVSQLLVGDHYENLIPGLENAKLTEAYRREFLIQAQKCLHEAKAYMESTGDTIFFLDKPYDWNRIIS